jgi:hypothetical protein
MNTKFLSVFRRTTSFLLTGAATIALQGIALQTANAHSLTVTASASCLSGAAVISYTAISWDQTDSAGSNPEIDILFNSVKVDAQPFSLATTPKNQFSGQKPAPATSSVTVEALAAAVWDDGFPSGQTSQVVIAVPTNCAPPPPSGCTVTQGGWGAPPHGDNPGAFLDAHFASGFPSGATIGGSPFKLLFTSAQAVRNFLPQGGPPSFLSASATNPTTSSAGVFGGQVLALDLNVVLYGLGTLTLTGTGTSLDGSTVAAVLAAANMALAGGPLPTGFTYSSLNDLIDQLNSSFDGCVRSGWAASHLH